MSDATHSPAPGPAHAEPNYMGVFYVLLALTIAEVAVVYFHFLPKIVISISLVVMAFTKAAVVAAYFMHLKFERLTLALIATTPILLIIFLTFMLLPDAI